MNLDFSQLRKITGGDQVLEAELFHVFLDTSNECMDFLRQSSDPGGEDMWKAQAHALKGISFAIGADDLGALCRRAQEEYLMEPADKKVLLAAIEQEYALVIEELKHQ
jgi:HPt (histidine-containing phosphotransfer) domain-containing protein